MLDVDKMFKHLSDMLILKTGNKNNIKYFWTILNYLLRMRSLGSRNGQVAPYLQKLNMD